MSADFLKRASENCGLVRERYSEKSIPTDASEIVILPLFGDYRTMAIASYLILKRYREECRGSKYFILLSWPGMQGLFPYVDEYWTISDTTQLKRFYSHAVGLKNTSDVYISYMQNINLFFKTVLNWKEIEEYYNFGIKQEFWKRFLHVKKFLPMVPSAAVLGKEFNRELANKAGYKIFIYPTTTIKSWRNGYLKNFPVKKDFWIALTKKLLENNFVPVFWSNYLSYDLSVDFTDQCIYLNEKDITKVMAAMRATGCVLDVMGESSKFAIAARCPFLTVTERSVFINTKDQEVNDLCAINLPHQYIFTFSTIITDGDSPNWNQDFFPLLISRLSGWLPDLDRDAWPSTGESVEIVPYENVRKNKNKKMGVRFIRIPYED